MTIVYLNVRNWDCTPSPGWTSVRASNGNPYSYHYSGGTDGQGDADFPVGSGPQQVQICFSPTCDARYQIQSVTLTGAASHDFSITGGSDPRSRTINDTDTDVDAVEYIVQVLDTVANCTIPCDPQIRNQPRK